MQILLDKSFVFFARSQEQPGEEWCYLHHNKGMDFPCKFQIKTQKSARR